MSETPILYSFRRCPYAMRARLAITISKRPVELREIVLRDKPPSMVEASPKATVPVLILPDGTVIDESLDIMYWALWQNDPDGWLQDDPEARKDIVDLTIQNIGAFKRHLDRYKYPSRYEGVDPLEERSGGHRILQNLSTQLDGKAFLFGPEPRFSDMALLPFIRQFANTDRAWFDALADIPHVQQWLETFLQSPLFLSIMNKFPIWQEGTDGVIFPA